MLFLQKLTNGPIKGSWSNNPEIGFKQKALDASCGIHQDRE